MNHKQIGFIKESERKRPKAALAGGVGGALAGFGAGTIGAGHIVNVSDIPRKIGDRAPITKFNMEKIIKKFKSLDKKGKAAILAPGLIGAYGGYRAGSRILGGKNK